jgi:membrane-bound lytic murein transglycosylase B
MSTGSKAAAGLGVCIWLASVPALAGPRATEPATPAAAAPSSEAFDPALPATWRLSAKLTSDSALRKALVRDLTARPTVAWEAALTEEEAQRLLDDPRAQPVYADKTISIVAPSMLKRQRQGHVDLLALFLKPERLEAAERFVAEHRELLESTQRKRGVDLEVIVSILMWESRLGSITGEFAAFNSFTSQAFFIDEANTIAISREEEKALLDPVKQPERVERIRQRARDNLVALARNCKARGIDPLSVKGSWAGALGFPQFMPASLRWAEDGDGDGTIDLFTFDDSIASIGRFLAEHGFAKSREKAVWGYNHEDAYVQGVLAFADALKERMSADAGTPPAPAISEKDQPVSGPPDP